MHQWGDVDLLVDAIKLCEQGKTEPANKSKIEEMLLKVEKNTPHMDDFEDEISSYALNASTVVYETLQFLVDKNRNHIFNIGTYLTDTVDCKIQEERHLSEDEIDQHPMMIEAREFVLTLSR